MNKVLKELISTGLYLLAVLCATWLLIAFVVQRTTVEGSSMETTLSDGDNLFVDKISYRFRDPERYDIIVFPPEYENLGNTGPTKYFIKRIIGLPGETVEIDGEGNIYIDGELLEESYGREVIEPDKVGTVDYPVVLGEDEYFVMGDNRNNSYDSRVAYIGNVRREDIVGRAWVRIWPLDKLGVITHQ